MKVKLEMHIDNDCLKLLKGRYENSTRKVTIKDLKEELTQMLFEVCEDWVLHQQEPDLEFDMK